MTADEIAKAISASIATIRRQRGMTLQDVADRAGLSKSHVGDL